MSISYLEPEKLIFFIDFYSFILKWTKINIIIYTMR